MDRLDSPLSTRAATILRQIADGRSYDQILMRHPELTYQDIFAAAQEALSKLQAGSASASAQNPAAAAKSVSPLVPGIASAATDEGLPPPRELSPPKTPSFIERARETHHRAWARWTPDEDEQLTRLFRRGAHLAEIGQALGRHNSAIRSRLVKLGLLSENDDVPDLLLKAADSPSCVNDDREIAPPPRSTSEWEGIRRHLERGPERD